MNRLAWLLILMMGLLLLIAPGCSEKIDEAAMDDTVIDKVVNDADATAEEEVVQVEEPKTWTLVFHDDFDGDKVDITKWNIESWASDRNNELQYYHPDEVYVEEGNLVLRSSIREHGGRQYTSGAVNSKKKFEFTYGKVEVRAKLPKGKGIWPAIWTLPYDWSWPPEIDIMEMLGHDPTKIHMTYHWGTLPDHFQTGDKYIGPDFSEDFHTFGVEWEPTEIRWYIDGELRKTYTSDTTIVDVPNYILLNTAVGGDWPGSPDDTTEFPQHYLIDYVKVWQLQ